MSFERYLDSFNICVTSFGFVLTLFPVYSSMRKDKR
jgi:amino acid permease